MLVALPSSIAYGVAVYALLGSEYVGHGVRCSSSIFESEPLHPASRTQRAAVPTAFTRFM